MIIVNAKSRIVDGRHVVMPIEDSLPFSEIYLLQSVISDPSGNCQSKIFNDSFGNYYFKQLCFTAIADVEKPALVIFQRTQTP